MPQEVATAFNRRTAETWGDSGWLLNLWAPSVADDPVVHYRWNRMLVFGGTPATAIAWLEMIQATDIRGTLPAIGVPTLVLHRATTGIIPAENGRYLGEHIPRRDRVLPHREHRHVRAGPRACDHGVHRHRRLDHARRRARRRLLATFDGPGRAIRSASEMRDAVRSLGLERRAGLHTGEVEVAGDDIQGIAVNIGAAPFATRSRRRGGPRRS